MKWTWLAVVALAAAAVAGTFLLAFPTRPGDTYTVESQDSLGASSWTVRQSSRGDGLEQTIRETMGSKRFFRVREQ